DGHGKPGKVRVGADNKPSPPLPFRTDYWTKVYRVLSQLSRWSSTATALKPAVRPWLPGWQPGGVSSSKQRTLGQPDRLGRPVIGYAPAGMPPHGRPYSRLRRRFGCETLLPRPA